MQSVQGDPQNHDLGRTRWLTVRNAAAEPAPAFGLLRVTGTDADGTTVVDKPNADSLAGLLVCGPAQIAAGGLGVATADDFVPVAYDAAATPAVGQTWGSASGSWLLTTGKSGWLVSGQPEAGLETVAAMRQAGGGSGVPQVPASGSLMLSGLSMYPSSSFSLATVTSAALPAGHTGYLNGTFGGVGAPFAAPVLDNSNPEFHPTSPPGPGPGVGVVAVAHATFFIGGTSGSPAGWFVVEARLGGGGHSFELASVYHPPGGPAFLATSSPFLLLGSVDAGGLSYNLNLTYQVRFWTANVGGWVTAGSPERIFRVCTSALGVTDPSDYAAGRRWLRTGFRGATGFAGCPAAVTAGGGIGDV